MKLVVDANIAVSAIVGRKDPIGAMVRAGATLFMPEPQALEAARILQRKFFFSEAEAFAALDDLFGGLQIIALDAIEPSHAVAASRLESRAQPDWPVLAAAIGLDAHIWSHDRDFFGVGVAVWKTANVVAAAAAVS